VPDAKVLERFPLSLNVCVSCWHSQLSVAVAPDLLFRDYLYVSGTTKTLRDYFEAFADRTLEDLYRTGQPRVLDIASNDGSLLAAYRSRGCSVIGVDPAANLIGKAAANGVDTICGYWPSTIASNLRAGFDIIVAMNVLAHVQAPDDFLLGVREVMSPDSVLYVQTSQARMVENREFDTAYHEHLSFFTCSSMLKLAERVDLHLANAYWAPIHGTSYVWEFRLPRDTDPVGQDLAALLSHEDSCGISQRATYSEFGSHAHSTAQWAKTKAAELRAGGFRVVGYGAAAKGNTFINFAGLDLELIADDNELKQGLQAPGSCVPVVAPSMLKDIDQRCAFVLPAWNFRDEICDHIRAIRGDRGDIAMTYFPTPTVTEI
jgi:2-polyprenyl-3-methyl-5-hydroxy-6-metoxy-1,4-benzoquinol methylase